MMNLYRPQASSRHINRWLLLIILLGAITFIAFQYPVPAQANGGPHGDYIATTDACAGCHRTHTANNARLLPTAANDNALCFACHNGTGAAPAPVVSTHGNTDFIGRAEGQFALNCTQCHDPHGSKTNIFSIKNYVLVQDGAGTLTTGPIQFTAVTGLNSFDDGVSTVNSRVCVACHNTAANPGYPMTGHTGGAGHLGGNDFTGQDCTSCHFHSADSDYSTQDGFMPVGGCTLCHASPVDNGDGIPTGGRRAVVGEFSNNSHHVQTAVTDQDCMACHYTGNHQSGFVKLYDADNPGNIITLNADPMTNAVEAKKLEPFCLSCHDGNGASGAAPFQDGVMPPALDTALWANSSHGNNATCFDCHNNGHGSVKVTLLGPYNATNDPTLPGDPLREQEGLCYLCHDADGPASVDIQNQFNLFSHHDVDSLEQQANGSKVECVDCHNPHTVNGINKTANPDNTNQLWTGTGVAFCQACHDGVPPGAVLFPTTSSGTGYDKSVYAGAHADQLGSDSCRLCHSEHGTNFISTLKDQFVIQDFNNYAVGDYQICWTCHDPDLVIGPDKNNKAVNAFSDLHWTHVVGEQATCIECHDTHRPHDIGEKGLITFDYPVSNGWTFWYIGGRNGSTAFWLNATETQGSCYLSCHNKDHKPKSYTRYEVNTVTACIACHSAPQDNGDGLPVGGRRAVVDEFGNTSHHVQGQITSTDCQVCHNETAGTNHQDGYLQLLNVDNGTTYTESASGAYRFPTNATDLSNLTNFCQSCHDANGANGNLAPFSDGVAPPVVSLHSNQDITSPAEAGFSVDCVQCHNGHSSATNNSIIKSDVLVAGATTTGPVALTARTGIDSFDEDDGTAPVNNVDDICVTCHVNSSNPGFPMTNHEGGINHIGGTNYAGQDCTTCHKHDVDNNALTRDGFMPVVSCVGCHSLPQDDGDGQPAGGRRAVVNEFGGTSHHVKKAQVTDADCQVCHSERYGQANHMNGIVQVINADTGADIAESFSGAFDTLTSQTDLANLTTFCQSCHDTNGAARLATPLDPFGDGNPPAVVSQHSNIDFNGGVEASFSVECMQCHTSHGSSNLSNVNPSIYVNPQTLVHTGPVVFTALTGTDSYDENDGGADVDDICATCHVNIANPGFPMTNHTGGDNHGGGTTSYAGQQCTVCHPHTADTTAATLDGFMPAGGCTACHASPQGTRRAVVNEFGQTSHHVQGQVTDTDCQVCHDTSNHQGGTVYINNVDLPGTSYAYNPADPSTVETACLACHDANGANGAAPFSDGIMPPVIDATLWGTTTHAQASANGAGTCFDCHTNGHGSPQTNILLDTYVMADYTNWNTANYQLCWKCHDPAKIVGTSKTNKAVNAFDDLHWIHVDGEQTPCVACHNPHAPHDAGEQGLVDFSYALANGFDMQLIGGRTVSTAFWINGNTGYCYIACHNKDHTPKNYRRRSTNTLWRIVQPDFDYIFKVFLPMVYKDAPEPPPVPVP